MDECLLQPPKAGEITAEAARRRLKEELGFETPLENIFCFYL
jgi:ADP-ribose pyrophosphatase YjhB (NUDIX family)